MTKEEITKAAMDCGLSPKIATFFADTLFHAMEFARAEEREECAKLVEGLFCEGSTPKECFEVAATFIRARGENEKENTEGRV